VKTNQSAVLDALGDPTRRGIFESLASGPAPVGAIAARLPISRPAVSQHLRVLKAAGLVVDRPSGARRLYEIDPRGIRELRGWLDGLWTTALAAFAAAAEATEASEEAT
jgi:DNA-binding transcriptional ArsR family regulator